ncbi:MAG: hypothetical protein LBT13_09395 [Treponema sp.]|jgi:hypothetical protein|nr:hypothetical protein [Treponema sp.]
MYYKILAVTVVYWQKTHGGVYGYTAYHWLSLWASAGIAWEIAQTKLKALEIRLAIVESEHKSDHDLLIEIRTKLDMLIQRGI